eukprot:1159960-Pelagomonas_calceolata.AAC.7
MLHLVLPIHTKLISVTVWKHPCLATRLFRQVMAEAAYWAGHPWLLLTHERMNHDFHRLIAPLRASIGSLSAHCTLVVPWPTPRCRPSTPSCAPLPCKRPAPYNDKSKKTKKKDKLPPCASIAVLKTGFLFAASEYGNHALYQFIVRAVMGQQGRDFRLLVWGSDGF